MREPQIETGDRDMALTWFVREVEGVALAEHDGGTNGQMARLMLAPEAGFALAILTNHSPAGNDVLRELSRVALRLYLGVDEPEPEPIDLSPEQLAEYAGDYTNPWSDVELRAEERRLVDRTTYKAGFPTKDTPPLPPPHRRHSPSTTPTGSSSRRARSRARRATSCATTTAASPGSAPAGACTPGGAE